MSVLKHLGLLSLGAVAAMALPSGQNPTGSPGGWGSGPYSMGNGTASVASSGSAAGTAYTTKTTVTNLHSSTTTEVFTVTVEPTSSSAPSASAAALSSSVLASSVGSCPVPQTVTVTATNLVTTTVSAAAAASSSSSSYLAPAQASSSHGYGHLSLHSKHSSWGTGYAASTGYAPSSGYASPSASSYAAPPSSSSAEVAAASTSANPSSSSYVAPSSSSVASSSALPSSSTTSAAGGQFYTAAASSSTSSTTSTTPTTTAAASSTVASSTSSSASATPTASGNGKRGLAYNSAALCDGFEGSSQVSWGYNWGSSSSGLSNSFNYVPLLWGTSSDFTSQWSEIASSAIENGATHLMSFNEPDQSSQSNLSPSDAASGYKQYMMPFAGKAKLGSPAVTNGGGQMGLTWLGNFIEACDGCQIDYINLHWYGIEASDLQSHIETAWKQFNKPIWVTEFAPTSGDTQDFLSQMLPWLDSQDYVERYAYFMVADGMLIEGEALSALGSLYNSN
ncbi:glycoside hydrolase family 128 protein [Xylona heveae TC161]|uniref:Glycoside hydrolase family 128 protein n=1 Tax=Xylona heveae (strain CBS 132557 / TC161) TaxID=1328760 RepID=A0A165GNB4_XYLHT|nr:glycoside hydrolase family 128 protein [Xylona heveae TC161]KZF22398.1 glycoside hydrolase family 128 protein [Xylona heveae TC161]